MILSASAFGKDKPSPDKLRVGVKLSAPFVIIDSLNISGLSVDLWEWIAPQLNIDFEYQIFGDLGQLLQAVENRDVDLCINPLTVTSERLKRFGFSQPYYISNMAIAVRVKEKSTLLTFLESIFSKQFLEVVLLLFFVIFIFGFMLWVFERRKNPKQFSTGWRGLGDGIWWSAVTMTTVGYGDKAPRSTAGRIISIVWMFTAVIIISSFTAGISAALTYSKLQASIHSIEDLRHVPVGTVKNSGTAEFLMDRGIRYRKYETLQESIDALNRDELKAVVYDEPLLAYLINTQKLDDRVELISSGINSVYFSFASTDHDFLKRLDPLLIQFIESREWKKTLDTYQLHTTN